MSLRVVSMKAHDDGSLVFVTTMRLQCLHERSYTMEVKDACVA